HVLHSFPTRRSSDLDPMFNQGSYAEIASYIASGGNCSSNTSTGNTPPAISAGAAYTIPILTAFSMSAQGSDSNGDALTYSWEERDRKSTRLNSSHLG